jgi:hypothetical protein
LTPGATLGEEIFRQIMDHPEGIWVGKVDTGHKLADVKTDDGKKYGANVNRLTKNMHRDQFGTPMHRYVPCRVEAVQR